MSAQMHNNYSLRVVMHPMTSLTLYRTQHICYNKLGSLQSPTRFSGLNPVCLCDHQKKMVFPSPQPPSPFMQPLLHLLQNRVCYWSPQEGEKPLCDCPSPCVLLFPLDLGFCCFCSSITGFYLQSDK